MSGLLDLARHLDGLNQNMGAVLQVIVEEGSQILKTAAKANIGTHRFAALSASTVDRKGHDMQLIETGALKASIHVEMGRHEAWIGSDDAKAAWMEFGTSRIPARPFMSTAVLDSIKPLKAMARRVVKASAGGHGHSALEEALHAAHRIYEEARETAETTLDR